MEVSDRVGDALDIAEAAKLELFGTNIGLTPEEVDWATNVIMTHEVPVVEWQEALDTFIFWKEAQD